MKRTWVHFLLTESVAIDNAQGNNNSSKMVKSSVRTLKFVAVIEAIIITLLILYISILKRDLSRALKDMSFKPMMPNDLQYHTNNITSSITVTPTQPYIICPESNSLTPSVRDNIKFRGVAVTTFLGSPKYVKPVPSCSLSSLLQFVELTVCIFIYCSGGFKIVILC